MNATYTLQSDASEDYAALVNVAGSSCAFFVLVVRDLKPAGQALKLVLEDLGEHLKDSSDRSEWPGTKLHGHTATVFTYHLDERSARKILKWASRFSAWIGPDRPEDLGFLRSDESTWLGSIAHEGDVFLKLSDDDYARLQADYPALAQKITRDSPKAS